MVERKNKGDKVDDGKAEVSPHLKNPTKTCFFGTLRTKSPKKKGSYICPPPFSPATGTRKVFKVPFCDRGQLIPFEGVFF
jgi:hypothetical protein